MGLINLLFKNKPDAMCFLNYVGGFPEWKNDLELLVKIYDKEIKFGVFNKKPLIETNLSEIDVTIENEKQFSERVTATRLLLVGIFAFAFKKKQNIENRYISFKFKEIDLKDKSRKYNDVEIVFTSKHPKQIDNLYNHIMRIKAQY